MLTFPPTSRRSTPLPSGARARCWGGPLRGPGGVGKTRLARAVGERIGGHFGSGAVFVPLAGVTAPELVVGGIGRAVGADLAGTGAPLPALAEQLGDGAPLLLLDNMEQATS